MSEIDKALANAEKALEELSETLSTVEYINTQPSIKVSQKLSNELRVRLGNVEKAMDDLRRETSKLKEKLHGHKG